MSAPAALYHLVRADFLERVRRYSFLVTMGFSVYLGYAVYAGQITLELADYRGVNNAPWVGAVMGMVASVWLTLIGFYIVKNTVERDRQTRVGQILAATPIKGYLYVLGKALSNFAVLALMVLVLAGAAVLIELASGTNPLADLPGLLGPILLLGLSAVAVTSALAVLFESIPGLRGGLGNVVYFFLWIPLLTAGAIHVEQAGLRPPLSILITDLSGMVTVMGQAQAALRLVDPLYKGGASFSLGGLHPATKTFVWNGLVWTPALVASRFLIAGFAALLAMVAAVFFDRFDPARGGFRRVAKAKKLSASSVSVPAVGGGWAGAVSRSAATLTRFSRSQVSSRMVGLIYAEVRLMVSGLRWWWYAVAGGLAVACVFAPLEAARGVILPVAWIWPLLIWSNLGAREQQGTVGALIFSGPGAAPRQLIASYAAGVLVAMAAGSGIAIRLALAGDGLGLAAWIAGALFVPALALACGVVSGTRKLFEAVYTAWWYTGPMHHIRGLDFAGSSAASSTPGIFLAAGAVLGVLAFAWRRTRLAWA